MCAGLNVDNIINGEDLIEEPSDSKQQNKEERSNEKSSLIDLKPPGVTLKTGNHKDYSHLYECETVLPLFSDCISKGQLISEWFVERFLNPGHVCNWDQGTCGKIF